MHSVGMILLPLLVLIPFLSIIPMLILDKEHSFKISVIFSAIMLLLTLFAVYMVYANGISSLDFSYSYIPQLGISLSLQLTQYTLILAVMTAVVFFAASLVGEYFIGEGQRLYTIIFAIAQGSALGLFLSGNLFLFYIFWELGEIMMFFIIFIYGGYLRRYAAYKFIFYSIVSSLLLLIGIMLIYINVTPHTFDINTIISNSSAIPHAAQVTIMVLLLIAFMIKIPIFPFHSWLPDAHTEAPTTGSMILAGVLLKFGGYGLLLLFLMIPLALHYSFYLALFFGFSTLYAAFVAIKQTNIKKMIAYTSITDMSIVAIGIAAANAFGTSGALYSMLSHGIAISVLFLIAGTLDELYGTLEISKISGVIKRFPALTYMFIFGSFAAVGIPLTASFIGDILLFIGSFSAFGFIGIIPIAGIFIIAGFLFWTIERMFMSRKETEPYNPIGMNVLYSGAFLLACTVIFGLLPFILIKLSGF